MHERSMPSQFLWVGSPPKYQCVPYGNGDDYTCHCAPPTRAPQPSFIDHEVPCVVTRVSRHSSWGGYSSVSPVNSATVPMWGNNWDLQSHLKMTEILHGIHGVLLITAPSQKQKVFILSYERLSNTIFICCSNHQTKEIYLSPPEKACFPVHPGMQSW